MPFIVSAQTSDKEKGNLKHPIIDSRMNEKEAFDELDPKCPPEIRARQKIVKVKYYSFDGRVHQGQLVIDKDLVADIEKIFKFALEQKFPINTVIPVSAPQFRKNERWDDDLSMIANNTSSFNYRLKTGGGDLSNHAYGRAIDINTVQNPYVKGSLILPPNGKYVPGTPGTFTADHPIVKMFISLGWDWGGGWTRLQDYQHFEKSLKTFGQRKVVEDSCKISAEVSFSSFTNNTGNNFLFVKSEYFTENSLKKIFLCLSAKYPKLLILDIKAFNNGKELKDEIFSFKNPVDSEPRYSLAELEKMRIIERQESQKLISQGILKAYYDRYLIGSKEESFRFGPNPEGRIWRSVKINQEDYINFGLSIPKNKNDNQ